MLKFDKGIVINTPKESGVAIVVYQNDKFYAKLKEEMYEIEYKICNYTTVYSLPNNDKHPAWTEKKNKIITNPIANAYWSPFKPGMKITGSIIKNKFIEKKSLTKRKQNGSKTKN